MVDALQNLAAKKYAEMAKNMADIKPIQQESQPAPNETASFGDLVKEGLEQAVAAQRKSEAVSAKAVVGEANLTDVVESITKAEVALDTVLAVRDRLLNAYQEVMRTQI
ncbi:MAG: flagellar hook-basal body complex protein FliE [Micavibrio sp.]|nr:flagellar hook-basal body complex protein FliE [Micavibrio sp.]HCK32494.1 flagellar hook-basal body complex protein FliE [Rhodospirillaceae bacterium]|tara:strand:- start:334 stop:660 length:327 start_codon:yes stop_codon:yes gene_type:complete